MILKKNPRKFNQIEVHCKKKKSTFLAVYCQKPRVMIKLIHFVLVNRNASVNEDDKNKTTGCNVK